MLSTQLSINYNEDKRLCPVFTKLHFEKFSVDIHPAAKIGSGILLDHATSFVAGETAVT